MRETSWVKIYSTWSIFIGDIYVELSYPRGELAGDTANQSQIPTTCEQKTKICSLSEGLLTLYASLKGQKFEIYLLLIQTEITRMGGPLIHSDNHSLWGICCEFETTRAGD